MTDTPHNPGPAIDRPLIVIGAGDHARVLIDLIQQLGLEMLFVTDHDPKRHGGQIHGLPVRGGDEEVLDHRPEQVLLVNAVGSVATPVSRRNAFDQFKERGYQFASIIHPSAVLSRRVCLGEGAQVMAGAVLQTNVMVGDNVLVNTNASVDHDCVIGDHVHIAPGATLSGRVRIGDTTHVGTGASVIQGVTVGRGAMVASGAVVVGEVPDGATVMGVPARPRVDKAPVAARNSDEFCILLSAAGRRVALLNLLRRSLDEMNLPGRVLATDINRASAAFQMADHGRIVPNYADSNCLEEMLGLCREFRVRLIVPTIDPDLPFYAKHRAAFEAIGTRIMISTPAAVDICNDKRATYGWLLGNGLPCLRQVDADVLLRDMGDWSYPMFVKPRRGASSVGASIVRNRTEFELAVAQREFIAQEVARGREYTVDVFVDRSGKCRCTVPRLRIATRGGEVSKGMTVRCRPIERLVRNVAEALPGGYGVMNIQVFYDEKTGTLVVSEINPRFGGGYPLTHQAGAPMTRWMIEDALDLPQSPRTNHWTNGLVMLRYDDAVFVGRSEAGISWPTGRTEVGPIRHVDTDTPRQPVTPNEQNQPASHDPKA